MVQLCCLVSQAKKGKPALAELIYIRGPINEWLFLAKKFPVLCEDLQVWNFDAIEHSAEQIYISEGLPLFVSYLLEFGNHLKCHRQLMFDVCQVHGYACD